MESTAVLPSMTGLVPLVVEWTRTFADLFDSNPNPVVVLNDAGEVILSNPEARSHRTGCATTMFLSATRNVGLLIGEVLSSGVAQRFEWGEQTQGVVQFWFAATLTRFESNGAVVGALCVSTDITELKRSEARLRQSEELMVDTNGVAHLGTWEWIVTEPHATWSAELYRVFGLTPESYTPTYDQYLLKIHPDDRERVAEATNRVFTEHLPYSHDERIFRPDGSMRWLHTWTYPVLDESGKLIKLVGVCQDITDRATAEEEVRLLNANLERLVAERTRTIERSMRDLEAFNSRVSHDLRAPLSTIQLTAEQLLRRSSPPLSESDRERVARMARASTRMQQLINDLLSLARMGQAKPQVEPVDLSPICLQILGDLAVRFPDRRVEFEVAPGLVVPGDRGLLTLVLENLLGNAWKYTGRTQQGVIEVGRAEGGKNPAVFVRDNGIGFDMAEANRLFHAFQRLSTAEEFEGVGVGLATVHRIIERHGGQIWAEAVPGQGAAFYFELGQST